MLGGVGVDRPCKPTVSHDIVPRGVPPDKAVVLAVTKTEFVSFSVTDIQLVGDALVPSGPHWYRPSSALDTFEIVKFVAL